MRELKLLNVDIAEMSFKKKRKILKLILTKKYHLKVTCEDKRWDINNSRILFSVIQFYLVSLIMKLLFYCDVKVYLLQIFIRASSH